MLRELIHHTAIGELNMRIDRSRTARERRNNRLIRYGTTLCLFLFASSLARAAEPLDCHTGSYQLKNGSLVDIAQSDGEALRWRLFDGTTGLLRKTADGKWASTYGWTDRPDGKQISFSDCEAENITFDGAPGHRIAFDVTDTTFNSHGTRLVGRLVMPKGNNKVPIVVLIHGSERDSALTFYSLQRMLPAQGVGAFVYDKRGTGISGGTYTQDFSLLADDAVAAIHEAQRLAGARLGRIGYQGGSEGGWVAPIAANRAPVDFVIVCFGLAVDVVDEDQQEVELEMREKGHSADEIAKALEVARAAETVMASGFTQGFGEFNAERAKYKNASWYKDLHGDYTYMLLPYTEDQLRKMAPKFKWGTPFYYDPMPTLRADTTSQLWILGGEDYEAPSAETSRRIKSLIADGRPYSLAIYPAAEHGMTLFETGADGERLSTRYAPGYFAMIRDFARQGRLDGNYGDAELTVPRGGAR
jgi:uncharacterized protein